MKILVIDEWLPWPLETGKKIRTYNLLSRLATGFDIHLLGYAKLPVEANKVAALNSSGICVHVVPDKRTVRWTPRFYLEVLRNVFSPAPFSSAYHIRLEFIQHLQKQIQVERPDLIHCEWTNLAPFLAHTGKMPKVISSHNVESDIWKRLAQYERNPLKSFVARQQAHKIETLERHWYPRVNCVTAVSEQDAETIASYGACVSVVPNGVDLDYFSGSYGETAENCLVFPASFDTFANQDAVHYFMGEIFPHLKVSCPHASVIFAGKSPPKNIMAYQAGNHGVQVTGTVSDMRPYLAKASVVVVPLRIGGGSRLKILEAMAMGKPVVSTSVGAEGLNVSPRENILIADDPKAFSAAVIHLLTNRAERNQIAAAGLTFVRHTYDWNVLATQQAKIWKNSYSESKVLSVDSVPEKNND